MRTRKWLESAALLLLGIYLLETRLSGEIGYYIAAQFFWLPIMAGLILIAIGAAQVSYLLGSAGQASTKADLLLAHSPHTQGVTWLSLILVCVPLVLGVVLPAKPLGASAVGASGIATSLNALNPSSSTGTFNLAPENRNVLDWVRAFSAAATPDEFTGQPADLIGFVYRDIRFNDDTQFMVARFAVSCCTADALAIGVIVEMPDSAKYKQDGWVRVRGKFQVREFDSHQTPVLIAESIEETAMPERPYLYP